MDFFVRIAATVYAIVTLLDAHCETAPAASDAGGEGLDPGNVWNYELHTNVLLSEKGVDSGTKEVGFMIAADLQVQSLWGNNAGDRLVRIEVQHPNLYIKSRKAPAPEGFVKHTSNLDKLKNRPFMIHWNRGRIQKILLAQDEPLPMANVKKGIAGLFQYQILDQESNETDASGHCRVMYTSTGPQEMTKTKLDCHSAPDLLPYLAHPEKVLGATVTSGRNNMYTLDKHDNSIITVSTVETHESYLTARNDVGNKIRATQFLKLKERTAKGAMSAGSLDAAIEKMGKQEGIAYRQETLITEKEKLACEDCKPFHQLVADYRDSLKKTLLGSLAPAKIAIKLIAAARDATADDVVKALAQKKNENILNQLYDILGYVQTPEVHEAVMMKLHFDDPKHEEQSERYLWALSMASQPNELVIEDLLKRHKKTLNMGEKVKETLILSIASMAYRFRKVPKNADNLGIYKEVETALINGLETNKGSDRYPYLRAMKNLKSEATIKPLLKIIRKANIKAEVYAWKALHAFDPATLTERVLKAATKTFFQLDRMHDSSSRTLALDIILSRQPKDAALKDLLYYLLSKDKAFEVKQYLVQKLKMMTEKCPKFERKLNRIIRNDPRINNYSVLGQRGLSTALNRRFLSHPSTNGSLVTLQEMHGGIVKRGIVNVMLEGEDESKEMLSLGIFSRGLSSFLSSSSNGDSEDGAPADDDTAVAGMELTVLGTQIRPFTFFTGQGELMGHVWSGTGSERTTAYQALAMLQDHMQYLRLGAGFIAELDVKGVISFDLSGKIEISLWNRNAESLVEKMAGVHVVGIAKVDTSFVRSQTEFTVSVEPKLSLRTDVDFSSNINLCMRLSQPDLIYSHNVFKIERIPGSKHRLRKSKYRKIPVPGKTYSLNKKNNDMCNNIFKK